MTSTTIVFDAVQHQLEMMADYLARLPEALDSYPEAQTKGLVLHTFIPVDARRRIVSRVPAKLQRLLDDMPSQQAWIPEVHAQALYLAQREILFDDDEGFVRFALTRNREIINSPMYSFIFRALLRALSQRAVARLSASSWGFVHRGSMLEVITSGNSARGIITMPAHLIPPIVGECLATALQVALEAGGATNVQARAIDARPTQLTYEATWD